MNRYRDRAEFVEKDYFFVDTDTDSIRLLRQSICKGDLEKSSFIMSSLRREERDIDIMEEKDVFGGTHERPWFSLVQEFAAPYIPDDLIITCILSAHKINKLPITKNLLTAMINNMMTISYSAFEYPNTEISDVIHDILDTKFLNLEEILVLLVTYMGLNINVTTEQERLTPLMISSIMLDYHLVELCLALGADKNVRDSRGRTALDIVIDMQPQHQDDVEIRPEIIELLSGERPSLEHVKRQILHNRETVEQHKTENKLILQKFHRNVDQHINEVVDQWGDIICSQEDLNDAYERHRYARGTTVRSQRMKNKLVGTLTLGMPFLSPWRR